MRRRACGCLREEDVGRLEVAVEHVEVVDVLEGVAQLVGPRDHAARRERLARRCALADGGFESSAVGELHKNQQLVGAATRRK